MRSIHALTSKPGRALSRRAAALIRLAALTYLVQFAALSAVVLQADEPVLVAYSFAKPTSGGVAAAEIDLSANKIVRSRVLFESPSCQKPFKVRVSANGKYVACTNIAKNGRRLFLWSPETPEKLHSFPLEAVPDELRISGHLAILTCGDSAVCFVDLEKRRVIATEHLDKTLTPQAHGPEDIHVVDSYAVVSLQKDSKGGRKKGSRLVIFELPSARRIADIQLPRDRPHLHIEGDLTEQGPGPEVVHVSTESDTLAVTLDLYGAVGVARWSRLLQGDDDDWKTISTSLTNDWGNAFPDRAALVTLNARACYLVCNSGPAGGCVLIDLADRRVVWRTATPPGLETPVFVPSLSKAYSVCSGKIKVRTPTKIDKKPPEPQTSLFVFDFSTLKLPEAQTTTTRPASSRPALQPSAASRPPADGAVTAVQMPGVTSQVALASEQPPRLLIACGPSLDVVDTLVLFDPTTNRIVDTQKATGSVVRFDR
jgi:hypothetical protein